MLFSALVMRYVSEKSTSNHEIGKQLQVTVIKVTESKENKSIHRLDVSGSTGPGGAAEILIGNTRCSRYFIFHHRHITRQIYRAIKSLFTFHIPFYYAK